MLAALKEFALVCHDAVHQTGANWWQTVSSIDTSSHICNRQHQPVRSVIGPSLRRP